MRSRVPCFGCFGLRELKAGHKFDNDARNLQLDSALHYAIGDAHDNLRQNLISALRKFAPSAYPGLADVSYLVSAILLLTAPMPFVNGQPTTSGWSIQVRTSSETRGRA